MAREKGASTKVPSMQAEALIDDKTTAFDCIPAQLVFTSGIQLGSSRLCT